MTAGAGGGEPAPSLSSSRVSSRHLMALSAAAERRARGETSAERGHPPGDVQPGQPARILHMGFEKLPSDS